MKGTESPLHTSIPSINNISYFQNVSSVIFNTSASDNRPYADVNIMGINQRGLLDSGATCCLLGGKLTKIISKLGLTQYPTTGTVKTADNTSHTVSFYALVPMEYNNRKGTVPVICVESMPEILILGMSFWNEFGVRISTCGIELSADSDMSLIQSLTVSQKKVLKDTIDMFPSSGKTGRLGRTHLYFHKIDTGVAIPIKQRYYPISKFVLDEINKEVDRMLEMDVIEEASCCPWNNPIVAVKKKDGSMRFCLDARKLNSIIVQEAYPIPHIASIMNNLSGSKFLSSIDLESAFWQIPLENGSKQKTAFTIPQRGHYQYKVVPFGLSTASQALSRVMNHLFIDLEPMVFVYLDDLIIATNDFDEHIRLLQEVAKRFQAAGLTINSEKSNFCRKSIKYLGYVLDENGWNVDSEKTEAISAFPTPSSKTELQRFLGMCGWYRHFIKDFSKVAAPLTELTRAKVKFRWSETCEKAFSTLKQLLCTAPVLATPDYTKPFSISCDASDIALGAVISQEHDGHEKAIAYFSQKLIPAERKYSVTERECLAVIRAIEKFRGYIEGITFTVYCDHSSLTYLKTMKNPTPLMARWILRLNAFNFDIRYRKGTCNIVPDCLSRPGEISFIWDDVTEATAPWYNQIREKVKLERDKYPDFKLIDQRLFKKCMIRDETGTRSIRWKEVVPENNRKEGIRRYHDLPTAAHLGHDRTLQKIQLYYYWPGMAQEINRYVKACNVCKASKPPTTTLTPTMGNVKPARHPWELLSIDWVGPITRSKNGNTVLLVIVDWVTKYVIAEPFRMASASHMVEFLEKYVFLKFSTPRIIITDNGSQFLSQCFESFLRRYDIKHMRTAFYSPMCNPAERTNRTLVTCIRTLIDDDQRDWDVHLQQVICAINTAKQETLGCSPYYANYGRHHVLFTEQYTQADLNTADDVSQSQKTRLKIIHNIQQFIVDRIKTAHQASKNRYDLRTRERKFAIGELVWRRSFQLSSAIDNRTKKLGPKYVPCYVREIIGKNNYRLEDIKTAASGVYHAKDIKEDT